MKAGDEKEKEELRDLKKQDRQAIDRMLFEIQRLKALLTMDNPDRGQSEGSP